MKQKVDYSKLWVRYKEMGHKNKSDLIELAGISTNILAKLNKGDLYLWKVYRRYVRLLTVMWAIYV